MRVRLYHELLGNPLLLIVVTCVGETTDLMPPASKLHRLHVLVYNITITMVQLCRQGFYVPMSQTLPTVVVAQLYIY